MATCPKHCFAGKPIYLHLQLRGGMCRLLRPIKGDRRAAMKEGFVPTVEQGQRGSLCTCRSNPGDCSAGSLNQGLMPTPADCQLGTVHAAQQHSHQEADEHAAIFTWVCAAQSVHDSEG